MLSNLVTLIAASLLVFHSAQVTEVHYAGNYGSLTATSVAADVAPEDAEVLLDPADKHFDEAVPSQKAVILTNLVQAMSQHWHDENGPLVDRYAAYLPPPGAANCKTMKIVINCHYAAITMFVRKHLEQRGIALLNMFGGDAKVEIPVCVEAWANSDVPVMIISRAVQTTGKSRVALIASGRGSDKTTSSSYSWTDLTTCGSKSPSEHSCSAPATAHVIHTRPTPRVLYSKLLLTLPCGDAASSVVVIVSRDKENGVTSYEVRPCGKGDVYQCKIDTANEWILAVGVYMQLREDEMPHIVTKCILVACIVAQQHPSDDLDRLYVDHADGNTLNDTHTNLHWVMPAFNTWNMERKERDGYFRVYLTRCKKNTITVKFHGVGQLSYDNFEMAGWVYNLVVHLA